MAPTHLSTENGTGKVNNTHQQKWSCWLYVEDTMEQGQNFELNMKVTVGAS